VVASGDSEHEWLAPPPAGLGDGRPAPQWDEGVLQALYEVAFSEKDTETIGVLVGQLSMGPAPARIAAMIPAGKARPPERARLTHQAWAYVYDMMSRHYGRLEIVGWWLSRPGPSTDVDAGELAAAAQTFAKPGQFGFVFDSVHRRAAYYVLDVGGYRRAHEQPVPRQITRARPTRDATVRSGATVFTGGVVLGVAAWVALGAPGLLLSRSGAR
jgi:hypothetical protein